MIVKRNVERVADSYSNFFLWLKRATPGNVLTVIDRRNVCAVVQIKSSTKEKAKGD